MGSEHLLLGLAREGKGVAAKVLQAAGVEPEGLKAAIAGLVGVGAPGGAPSQGLTPRCKKIIELSLAEAARLGHHYVGTEHLLLGILREGDGVAVRVLTGMGTEPRRLHADVVAAMGGDASPSPFRGNGKTREREYGGDARLLEQFARDLTRLAAGGMLDPVVRPGGEEIKRVIPDPLPPSEEQPRPHRRARRGQDRRGRGPGPPDGCRGRARRAALQAPHGPGSLRHGGGHQVPGGI